MVKVFPLGYYNVTGRAYSVSFKATPYIALNAISSHFRCYTKLTTLISSTFLEIIREGISIKDVSVSDPVTFTHIRWSSQLHLGTSIL